jgi:hypothetical protein
MVRAAAPDFPNAIGTNPVTVAEYRVVGVTTAVTDGRAEAQAESGVPLIGFAAMDRLCQLEFPGSRMATAREWQTSQVFTFPAGVTKVWLDPGPIALVFDPTQASDRDWTAYMTDARQGLIQTIKSNPEAAAADMSCLGYVRDELGTSGTFGNEEKLVGTTSCITTNAVGCAALIAVPVSP